MITLNISDVISFGIVFLSLAITIAGFLFVYRQVSISRYDTEKHRVEIEMMRKSIESQMYGLNDKLLATESRWRDVNHLLISSQTKQPELAEVSDQHELTPYLKSAGITNADMKVDEKLIFVLTPFHPKYRNDFEVISQVCQQLGLRAVRGDEDFIDGDVFPHILKLIVKARLVIANINGRNPNVFFELGIAQALGKTTILVTTKPTEVPFDVRTKRLVVFENHDSLREQLGIELAKSFL